MKISSIAIGLAITLTAPVAAQAGSNCGVPQGYGTNNTHTFNRSTCGFLLTFKSKTPRNEFSGLLQNRRRGVSDLGAYYCTSGPVIPLEVGRISCFTFGASENSPVLFFTT